MSGRRSRHSLDLWVQADGLNLFSGLKAARSGQYGTRAELQAIAGRELTCTWVSSIWGLFEDNRLVCTWFYARPIGGRMSPGQVGVLQGARLGFGVYSTTSADGL